MNRDSHLIFEKYQDNIKFKKINGYYDVTRFILYAPMNIWWGGQSEETIPYLSTWVDETGKHYPWSIESDKQSNAVKVLWRNKGKIFTGFLFLGHDIEPIRSVREWPRNINISDIDTVTNVTYI